jgi:hypothetical protein
MAENQNNGIESALVKGLTAVVKEVGLPSFLVLCAITFVIYFASPDQKKEIIDRYVLLKEIERNQLPACLVVLVLFGTIIARDWYWRTRVKLVEAERDRIGHEKSELQKILNGSDNPTRTSI